MNFLHLKYFLLVAEELNITRAAERLYISQQSLSNHISNLERELDVKLFTRSPKLSLTYAGDMLVDTATQILDLHSQFLTKVGDINRHYMGMLRLGISQVSGGSRTSVGGYTQEERPHDTEQFDVSDQRTLDEVVRWLMENGHIPSFCTACYREGRTGDRFMSLCKSGQILNCCHPNALMTLSEYLEDYASPETKEVGYKMVEEELKRIPKDKVREIAEQNIQDIKNSNRRDFRF